MDLSIYFTTLLAASGLTTLVTGWIFTQVIKKDVPNWIKQLTSWLVAIAVSFAGNFYSLGMFMDMSVLQVVLNGIGVALIANGIFTYDIIQAILAIVGARKKG